MGNATSKGNDKAIAAAFAALASDDGKVKITDDAALNAAIKVAHLKQRELKKADLKDAKPFFEEELDLEAYGKAMHALIGLAEARRHAVVAALFAKVHAEAEKKAGEKEVAADKPKEAKAGEDEKKDATAEKKDEKEAEAKKDTPAEEKKEESVAVSALVQAATAAALKGHEELVALESPSTFTGETYYIAYVKSALSAMKADDKVTAKQVEDALDLPSFTAESLVEAASSKGLGDLNLGLPSIPNPAALAEENARLAAEKAKETARLAAQKAQEGAKMVGEGIGKAGALVGDGASMALEKSMAAGKAVQEGFTTVGTKISEGVEKVPGGGLISGFFSAVRGSVGNIATCGGRITTTDGKDKAKDAPVEHKKEAGAVEVAGDAAAPPAAAAAAEAAPTPAASS